MTATRINRFLYDARPWVLAAICFVLPMKASFIYVLSALLLLIHLGEGNLREKLTAILRSNVCRAFIAYYLVVLLGMLWTEDTSAGWRMVSRQAPFLLFLLYWSCAEKRYQQRYISAFLGGLAVCAILAHYNLLQMHVFTDWPAGLRVVKDPADTAPFVDRILYTPILALGAWLGLRRTAYAADWRQRMIAGAVTCLLVSNLMFSGGRAGMVMFAVLCISVAFERIAVRKALLFCAVVLPLLFFSAYRTQDYLAERVDHAINDLRTFDQNQNTSVGLRLVYWATTASVIMKNPILGVGTGDFLHEYVRAKPARWQATPDAFNPHNQFLLTTAITGFAGLLSLLAVFYFTSRETGSFAVNAMLLGFAVVCMFESYLWRSNTALAFAVILAVLLTPQRNVTET